MRKLKGKSGRDNDSMFKKIYIKPFCLIRELESSLTAKDRIINDIRLQTPDSVNSAVAAASVISAGRSGKALNLLLL